MRILSFIVILLLHGGAIIKVTLIVSATTCLQVLSVQPSKTDMMILQNNIQSVSTSLLLLWQMLQRLDIDVVLLQEVWQPANDSTDVRNYINQRVML